MLTEMNTDQKYVVDAFLIPYKARFVLCFFPFVFHGTLSWFG